MVDYLGPGVSRTLISDDTQYVETIWQQGKPPTDADLNLIQTLASDATRQAVLRGVPSGFLGNETNAQRVFLTNPNWSNYFRFGPQRTGELCPIMWANVNGWLIPVAGTRTGSSQDTDFSNVVVLDPPPGNAGDFRTDFVFLEVWKARIQPNGTPPVANKPSASAIYRLGNVEGGFNYLADDLVDPAIGYETNQRVQIQHRIRVVKGLVGLATNPDGFDRSVVKAQGAALEPIAAFPFTNMRSVLGDPGLWRAGDGIQNALGTVDGYSYAIPIAVVFRRNGVEWTGTPSQNLNGGLNRNPLATDRRAIKTFSTVPTLATDATATSMTLTLVSAGDIPLPETAMPPGLIRVGDELMIYKTVTGSTVNLERRAANNTLAEAHKAGSVVYLVSGRPDGLFSDQIANTDILDLRHVVNPNGFDYVSLLKGNLDKLLRGQLRANWKLSGSDPRGPFVYYQDVITTVDVALGVTKVDAPDNIRMVFSDAATVQPIELVCRPAGAAVDGGNVSIGQDWALSLTVNATKQDEAKKFKPGDVIVVDINQLKHGLQAGANDQVRWLNDAALGAVQLRLEGETSDLPPTYKQTPTSPEQVMYTVTPASPTPNEALTITLGADFPQIDDNDSNSPRSLHIRAHVVYGPGRGLARRPDVLHSISYVTPSADLMVQLAELPTTYRAANVAWAPLWSRYRRETLNGLLPVTSEMYADLGSKTVVVSPFRRMDFYTLLTIDGRAANPYLTVKSTLSGTLSGGNTINVASAAGVVAGDALIVPNGSAGAGRYTVSSVSATQIRVDRPVRAVANTPLTFEIREAQGLMPTQRPDRTNKYNQTDPLGLFCSTRASISGVQNAAYESIYVSLPRHLVPGWGELRLPIMSAGTTTFASGINYMVRTSVGSSDVANQGNYAAYFSGSTAGTNNYQVFSQLTANLQDPQPLDYNTASQGTEGNPWAGIRFFNDTRGLGRKGLEFPPFYGLARVFGVYQASDYTKNGSPFTNDRDTGGTGRAVNLLRQSMAPQDGPVLWIETDRDGDSTFILNANAINLAKAPTPIASFAAGTYVVEAVVFGFDRGSFDVNQEFRLVLTRPSPNRNGWAADKADRDKNINKGVVGLHGLLPGPAQQSDQIVVNYSRTVYQGDAWGSQTSNTDLTYAPGPLTSEVASLVVNNPLNQAVLTRPNQKVLEVLAATSFSTDLGTGRYSGDASTNPVDFRDVAYEDPDPLVYPPTDQTAERPKSLPGNFHSSGGDNANVGTEYLGCVERLPLGALFRDKDFRGQSFSNLMPAPLVYSDVVGNGAAIGMAVNPSTEQNEVPLSAGNSGVGSPGEIVVHVDGERDYAQQRNFRTTRGGSVFSANGGPLSFQNPATFVLSESGKIPHATILHGRAMLVRNTVTNIGVNEVSAGDELMMLILTSVDRPKTAPSAAYITIGTNGAGEGYAAADLYRIEGHPLARNNVHMQLDPGTIKLSPR